jgi:RHS repeat-associated protein
MAVRELTEDGTTIEFQYDPAGRQVSGGGRTITWNEFDLPRRIQSGASDLTFLYDAAGNRTVKQSGPSTSTVYVGGVYELHTTAAGETHVFNLVGPAGVFGQMLWKTTGSGAPSEESWYFHPDSLGTPDLATSDGTGAALRRTKHEPFGQRRDETAVASPAALPSASSVGFTGHEADDEVGLINMRGRIYDPRTMRFLTPDPIVQSPLFSQSLNRYSYVYNNPINFTDPTGFECAGNPAGCVEQPPPSPPPSGGGGPGGGGRGPGLEGGTPLNDPTYLCHFNPSDCPGPGATAGGNTQQTPTREDQTRRGADAGPGWGRGGSSSRYAPAPVTGQVGRATAIWPLGQGYGKPFVITCPGSCHDKRTAGQVRYEMTLEQQQQIARVWATGMGKLFRSKTVGVVAYRYAMRSPWVQGADPTEVSASADETELSRLLELFFSGAIDINELESGLQEELDEVKRPRRDLLLDQGVQPGAAYGLPDRTDLEEAAYRLFMQRRRGAGPLFLDEYIARINNLLWKIRHGYPPNWW